MSLLTVRIFLVVTSAAVHLDLLEMDLAAQVRFCSSVNEANEGKKLRIIKWLKITN